MLLLKKDINRHSEDGEWEVVACLEEGNDPQDEIASRVEDFQKAGDGYGTKFATVSKENFTQMPDGRYFWHGPSIRELYHLRAELDKVLTPF